MSWENGSFRNPKFIGQGAVTEPSTGDIDGLDDRIDSVCGAEGDSVIFFDALEVGDKEPGGDIAGHEVEELCEPIAAGADNEAGAKDGPNHAAAAEERFAFVFRSLIFGHTISTDAEGGDEDEAIYCFITGGEDEIFCAATVDAIEGLAAVFADDADGVDDSECAGSEVGEGGGFIERAGAREGGEVGESHLDAHGAAHRVLRPKASSGAFG